ncbi:hypothetical protein [Streptomyces sp. NPDC057426]|uniref:hypothetical protein n=1 Tax=Streptomyces sp. NPDC057426 TaxID=3346128 RepID=UPI00367E87C6
MVRLRGSSGSRTTQSCQRPIGNRARKPPRFARTCWETVTTPGRSSLPTVTTAGKEQPPGPADPDPVPRTIFRRHAPGDPGAKVAVLGAGAIGAVASPHDDPAPHGNLCIKGRFGFQHVENRV